MPDKKEWQKVEENVMLLVKDKAFSCGYGTLWYMEFINFYPFCHIQLKHTLIAYIKLYFFNLYCTIQYCYITLHFNALKK